MYWKAHEPGAPPTQVTAANCCPPQFILGSINHCLFVAPGPGGPPEPDGKLSGARAGVPGAAVCPGRLHWAHGWIGRRDDN